MSYESMFNWNRNTPIQTAGMSNMQDIGGWGAFMDTMRPPVNTQPNMLQGAPFAMSGMPVNSGVSPDKFFSMKSFLGGTDADGITKGGWGMPAIAGASTLAQGFMGMKNYGLAKRGFAENTRQFNMNFENQRKMTNAQLEDRQRARVASNPNAYESVDSYMKKYGV